ncbi:pyridoxine/pyridoxamine 5'-phosphate oxidase isoform X2 [Cotesia typhae]|uniref:pyridoxine/pyridoxamine 5'-phosphate oxidase isoform X2 n=1 Tax=Cotesia typhae TaxID=2053667 RepID=UPI003D6917FD
MEAKDQKSGLAFIDLKSNDPVNLYEDWHQEAMKYMKGSTSITCLATVSGETPRARHVLLRGYGKNGFEFFTDSRGRKSQELSENSQAAMCIYWMYENDKSERVSRQDAKVDWTEMKERHDELLRQAESDPESLVMPEHFVGYKLIPTWFDFYFSKDNFIADRMEFTNVDGVWTNMRIAA